MSGLERGLIVVFVFFLFVFFSAIWCVVYSNWLFFSLHFLDEPRTSLFSDVFCFIIFLEESECFLSIAPGVFAPYRFVSAAWYWVAWR